MGLKQNLSKCSQTRISHGFALIVDDTGHRKSGNFTSGVGRQYIGEIGKTDNGIVAVTTHLWQKFTGGLQRRWANRPLNTSTEALEAFRTAMSFRFFDWLTKNMDVFASHKASLGFIWA